MNPRIDKQHAALRGARVAIRRVIGAEAVDPAGLDVDTRDLGAVVCGEDCELDRAAPGVRREDRADVLFAWTPVPFVEEPPEPDVREKIYKREDFLRYKGTDTYPRMTSLQVSGSRRIAWATTAKWCKS